MAIAGGNNGVTWAGCLLENFGQAFVEKISKLYSYRQSEVIEAGDPDLGSTASDGHISSR